MIKAVAGKNVTISDWSEIIDESNPDNNVIVKDTEKETLVNITLKDGTILPVEFKEYDSVSAAREEILPNASNTRTFARTISRTANSDMEDIEFFVEQVVEAYGDNVKSNTKDKAKRKSSLAARCGLLIFVVSVFLILL